MQPVIGLLTGNCFLLHQKTLLLMKIQKHHNSAGDLKYGNHSIYLLQFLRILYSLTKMMGLWGLRLYKSLFINLYHWELFLTNFKFSAICPATFAPFKIIRITSVWTDLTPFFVCKIEESFGRRLIRKALNVDMFCCTSFSFISVFLIEGDTAAKTGELPILDVKFCNFLQS